MSEDKTPDDEELNKLLGELANTDPLEPCDTTKGKKAEEVFMAPKPRPVKSVIDVSIVTCSSTDGKSI